MTLSVLDLFSIGIGPSSSHTVGPMRAALRFVEELKTADQLTSVARVKAELYGSLGATGIGHGSDRAVILGLAGHDPETVDADAAPSLVDTTIESGRLELGGVHDIAFDRSKDLVLHRRRSLPGHPNGMRLDAYDDAGEVLSSREYFSVGGGFVVTSDELDDTVEQSADVEQDAVGDRETEAGGVAEAAEAIAASAAAETAPQEPYPFTTGDELLAQCRASGLSIAGVMRANESAHRDLAEVEAGLLKIWAVMQECVENGCTRTETTLPGGLKVRRRAPDLRSRLEAQDAERTGTSPEDRLGAMEWVNLYALAVNEENASGGRIVTAPTNGAAGIIPAVMHFYTEFVDTTEGAEHDARIVDFLLTAGAIGMLYKRNASISGAEMGCQGEVGSACSMAAGALCAVLGGTPEQVENAAEIGIEHNLGLTCDPVGGLVQIPCIERNAMASVKAINAARLAMHGDGEHRVSLDQAINTMRETGEDMKSKYKETSRGGLAVNVTEC